MIRATLLSLCLIAAVCSVVPTGCDDKPRVIHFVLPDGYRGYFWIIEDPLQGREVDGDADPVVLEIPRSGVLPVKDASFFGRSHRMKATYAAGGALQAQTDDSVRPDGAIVWVLSASSEGVYTCLVGTVEERRQYDKFGGTTDASRQLKDRLRERR